MCALTAPMRWPRRSSGSTPLPPKAHGRWAISPTRPLRGWTKNSPHPCMQRLMRRTASRCWLLRCFMHPMRRLILRKAHRLAGCRNPHPQPCPCPSGRSTKMPQATRKKLPPCARPLPLAICTRSTTRCGPAPAPGPTLRPGTTTKPCASASRRLTAPTWILVIGTFFRSRPNCFLTGTAPAARSPPAL